MKRFILLISLIILGFMDINNIYAADVFDIYFRWRGVKKPLIGLEYGYGRIENETFSDEFNNIGQIDLKLGYSREFESDLYWIDETFFLGSYKSNKLNYKDAGSDDSVDSEIFTAGFGSCEGFAYNLNKIYIFPYTEYGFSWSKVEFSSPDDLRRKDFDLLNRYEDSTRFGYSNEAGIAFGIANGMELRAGYNFSIINPRVVFWEFAASHLIEYIGYNLISSFALNIVNVSPVLGPVIYSALRGAYMYAFHYMRKDGMDWPFSSEKPIACELYKFGFTVKF